MDVLLFVYGTLMNPKKAERIFGRLPEAKVAFLPGYELVFNKEGTGKGNPNVRPGKGGVWGVVYHVSERDLRKLDKVSPKYERKIVKVVVDGEEREAWIYVAKPEFVRDDLEPDPSCVERIVEGARFHGLPEEYIRRLERILKDSTIAR